MRPKKKSFLLSVSVHCNVIKCTPPPPTLMLSFQLSLNNFPFHIIWYARHCVSIFNSLLQSNPHNFYYFSFYSLNAVIIIFTAPLFLSHTISVQIKIFKWPFNAHTLPLCAIFFRQRFNWFFNSVFHIFYFITTQNLYSIIIRLILLIYLDFFFVLLFLFKSI